MSVVEDVWKVLQDFPAPELRSISSRMDNLQKQLDTAEKQRAEDKAEILRAINSGNVHMEKRFELVVG